MKKIVMFSKHFLVYLILTIAVVVSIMPILWLVSLSIKQPLDIVAIPPKLIFKPTLKSYRLLFSGQGTTNVVNLYLFLKNSSSIAFMSTIITMVFSVLGAYSLARFRFKGRGIIGVLVLTTRMLPPLASAIPLFLIFQKASLYDTRLGLVIAYTAVNIPFAIWMIRGYINDVPVEIEEAAHMDGCTRVGMLWRIVIPIVTPGISAAAAYTFILSWNDFALALMLTSRNAKTMPLMVLSFLTAEGIEYGPMTAAATIALIPPIIFVIFAQKYLARGLTMGAVKG